MPRSKGQTNLVIASPRLTEAVSNLALEVKGGKHQKRLLVAVSDLASTLEEIASAEESSSTGATSTAKYLTAEIEKFNQGLRQLIHHIEHKWYK